MNEREPKCPTCGSRGFDDSILPDRCTFCDGTEGGNPPTQDDVRRYWNSTDDEEWL